MSNRDSSPQPQASVYVEICLGQEVTRNGCFLFSGGNDA